MTKRVPPFVLLAAAGATLLVLSAVLLLREAHGTTFRELWAALLAGPDGDSTVPVEHTAIVFEVRLPRILVAVLAGASLALAGTVMQAVFRNPLASPEVMGTAAGSALGAVVAIAVGLSSTAALATPACALLGAALVSAVVYGAAAGHGGASVTGILLAGMAMNSLVGALTAFFVSSFLGTWSSGEVLHWLMGGLDSSTLQHATIMAVALLVFGGVLVPLARELDLLTLADESAESLGVRVTTLRPWLLAIACGITAAAVSSTGGITFVGLVVPHLVRLLVGPAHRGLMPCAAFAGALLLLIADGICQLAGSAAHLRVGVVTAFLGAPFFLWLLARHQRGCAL